MTSYIVSNTLDIRIGDIKVLLLYNTTPKAIFATRLTIYSS